MRPKYWQAIIVGVVGVASITWSMLGGDASLVGLFVGAGAVPVAILLAVSGRMGMSPRAGSVIGGATIGPAMAIFSHAFVFGFAYLFFFGFAEAAATAMEILRVDPTFLEVAASPWTVLFFIELALVAPLTEEVGKAIGASFGRPQTRAEAFMAGVAAGVGFAVVEDIMYATGGFFFTSGWEAVASVRMLSAAVHPLASGIVALGWWEWRQRRDLGLLARRFLTGVGVHAIWNGSIVALITVGEAYGIEGLLGFGSIGIAYSAGLGVVATGVLWRMALTITKDPEKVFAFDAMDIRSIGAWTIVASSLLVPIALLFLGFPSLVSG